MRGGHGVPGEIADMRQTLMTYDGAAIIQTVMKVYRKQQIRF
jgi:hypothetical protein